MEAFGRVRTRPAGEAQSERQARFHDQGRKDRVAVVAVVMSVIALALARVAGCVVVVPVRVIVVAVGMHAEGCHVLAQVPVQAGRRGPGELERNDEHDDQGNEAAHGVEYKPMAAGMRQAGADTICLPLVKFLSGTSSAA